MKTILGMFGILALSSCASISSNANEETERVYISEPRSGRLEKIDYYYDGMYLPRRISIDFRRVEREEDGYRQLVPNGLSTSICSGKRIRIDEKAFADFRGSFYRFTAYNDNTKTRGCDIAQISFYIVQKEVPNGDADAIYHTYIGKYNSQNGWSFVLANE